MTFLLCCLFLGGLTAFAQEEPATDDPAPAAAAPAEEAGEVDAGGSAPGAGDYAAGKSAWNANGCGSCHIRSMKDDGTGPALGGVEQRWASEPREHLYRWIQNSQKLIASGESARAIAVYNDWKPTVMSAYTALTPDDIENLLAYIDGEYTGNKPGGTTADGGEVAVVAGEASIIPGSLLSSVFHCFCYCSSSPG